MQFIDEATVHVKGGDGGAGIVHWRREKFVPRGGPDGGNGGNGGAIVFEASARLNTLIDFTYQPHLTAQSGSPGAENLKTGADGEDMLISVPIGMQVFFEGRMIADLKKEGARWIAARGGRGGKGNTHFKKSTHQSPDYAQTGVAGEERTYRLVLKSIADVGLVGLPNAGKSTLVRTISAAKPKVANYPFTTLRPELGVVVLTEGRRFVIADIPGIIAGASEGKGLGLQFLKHIERTKTLMVIVDCTQTPFYLNLQATEMNFDPSSLSESDFDTLLAESLGQLELLKNELSSYSTLVAEKPIVIGFSKSDMPLVNQIFERMSQSLETKCILFSSAGHQNLDAVSEILWSTAYQDLQVKP